eukprot:gene10433-19232_t
MGWTQATAQATPGHRLGHPRPPIGIANKNKRKM